MLLSVVSPSQKAAFSGQVESKAGGVQVLSRFAQQPEGLDLDGFCSPTTLTNSGRKMLFAVGVAYRFSSLARE